MAQDNASARTDLNEMRGRRGELIGGQNTKFEKGAQLAPSYGGKSKDDMEEMSWEQDTLLSSHVSLKTEWKKGKSGGVRWRKAHSHAQPVPC